MADITESDVLGIRKAFDQNADFRLDWHDPDEASDGYQLKWVGKNYARLQSKTLPTTVIEPDEVHNSKDENSKSNNLIFTGDNLEVLKHLRRSYSAKVDCIYIDPPYNTGSEGDFVYPDKFDFDEGELTEMLGMTTEDINRLNNIKGRSSHSAWLTFMYPRLRAAHDLLKETGVIFISIDDNEQANLKLLCDEVFGENNFVSTIVWERAFSPVNLMKHFSVSHDYILCYAKDIEKTVCNGIQRNYKNDVRYSNPDNDSRGKWSSSDISVGPAIQSNIYPITTPSGKVVYPPSGRSWSLSQKVFQDKLNDNRIWFGSDGDNVPRIKRFLSELKKTGVTPMSIWKYTEVDHSQGATQKLIQQFDGKKVFDYPKPVELIRRCLSLYTSSDSLILDFFAGSGTTGEAVMRLNAEDGGHRKFILVQIAEQIKEDKEAYKAGYKTIDEITRARVVKAADAIKKDNALDLHALDLGFRHFTARELPGATIDEICEFDDKDAGELLLKEDYVEALGGVGTVLATYMMQDGVALTAEVKKEDLGGYTGYRVEESHVFYALEPGWGTEQTMALVNKIGRGEWVLTKVVVCMYCMDAKGLTELELAMKQAVVQKLEDNAPRLLKRW